MVEKFLNGINNEGSRREYRQRLKWFDRFCDKFCGCEPLAGTYSVVERIKLFKHELKGYLNPYELLDDFKAYFLEMNRSGNRKPIGTRSIIFRIDTAADFIEWATAHRIEIKRKSLKKMLHYGDILEREPYTLERHEIINLLTTPFNYRLTVFLHFLLVVGARPIEVCRLKNSDLDLTSNPPKVHFPASITKIKRERTNELTGELARILQDWLDHKSRTRNKVTTLREQSNTGAWTKTETITPKLNSNDLLFAITTEGAINPDSIYNQLQLNFEKLLKKTKLDMKYEDGIHKITFSSCRDYVKTMISNTGNTDFAEYWIGHKGKFNYWTSKGKKEIDAKTRTELFKKVEHLLIYLDKDQVVEVTKDLESRADVHKEEITQLKRELTKTQDVMKKMQQENTENINRLLSLIAKESIVGKPAIPKENLDLIFSGQFGSIPLPVTNKEGKDVKEFHISKDLESIKNNYEEQSKRAKKLVKKLPKGMKQVYIMKDPPEEFKTK